MSQTQTTSAARDTHVYKVVDGREVEADVIGAHSGASKPCVVWIHGGGLIFGWRKTSPRGPLLRALLERDECFTPLRTVLEKVEGALPHLRCDDF